MYSFFTVRTALFSMLFLMCTILFFVHDTVFTEIKSILLYFTTSGFSRNQKGFSRPSRGCFGPKRFFSKPRGFSRTPHRTPSSVCVMCRIRYYCVQFLHDSVFIVLLRFLLCMILFLFCTNLFQLCTILVLLCKILFLIR